MGSTGQYPPNASRSNEPSRASRTFLARAWVKDAFVGLVAGAVVAGGTLWGQALVDDQRSDREAVAARTLATDADRRENLRFVRDRSSPNPTERPFTSMDLTGQVLDGLDLSGANFNGAILTNTSFRLTKLDGAIFIGADLRNADLTAARANKADFLGANLDGATLHNAFLDGASLRNTDLRNTDLSTTSVRGTLFYGSKFSKNTFNVDPKMGGQDFVCYDDNTQWPDGAIPSEGLFAKDPCQRDLE